MPRDWDRHYGTQATHRTDVEPLLVEAAELLPPGDALDLACGTGRHAAYLSALGWRVTAVDRSRVAVDIVRRHTAAVVARVADLERHEFHIEPDRYGLICDFYYLQRDLFPAIRAGIRPGGVFVGAIHLVDETGGDAQPPSGFRLRSGELREFFDGWKAVYYSEGTEAGHSRRAARIIARRA